MRLSEAEYQSWLKRTSSKPSTKTQKSMRVQVVEQCMTESAFQSSVIDLARLNGWKHYHTHDSRKSVQGFPDLILIRDGRLIAAELKTMDGKASKFQVDWLEAFNDVPGAESYLWRPSNWNEIQEILKRR